MNLMELSQNLQFTRHGKDRKKTRGINNRMIRTAIENPVEVIEEKGDCIKIIGKAVTVVATRGPASKIVTVFYTTETYEEKKTMKTTHLTFGQMAAIQKASGMTEKEFSLELGHAANWFCATKKRKSLSDPMLDKTAYEVAERFPEETAKWLDATKLAWLEKTYGNPVVTSKVQMTSPTPVPTLKVAPKTSSSTTVASVKRALVGILNEDRPLNLKLTDELLAKIVEVTTGGVR